VVLGPGGTLRIHPNTWHRFTGVTDAVIFEFSTHHEDDDSYRSEKSGPVTDTQAVYCDRMALVEGRK
jgi:D-lyxose ketol-isomerase